MDGDGCVWDSDFGVKVHAAASLFALVCLSEGIC